MAISNLEKQTRDQVSSISSVFAKKDDVSRQLAYGALTSKGVQTPGEAVREN